MNWKENMHLNGWLRPHKAVRESTACINICSIALDFINSEHSRCKTFESGSSKNVAWLLMGVSNKGITLYLFVKWSAQSKWVFCFSHIFFSFMAQTQKGWRITQTVRDKHSQRCHLAWLHVACLMALPNFIHNCAKNISDTWPWFLQLYCLQLWTQYFSAW